jgi:hypothetical protein
LLERLVTKAQIHSHNPCSLRELVRHSPTRGSSTPCAVPSSQAEAIVSQLALLLSADQAKHVS